MKTLLVRPIEHLDFLDERAQVDPGLIDSNIAAIVADFLRAQIDPGNCYTQRQFDPGLQTNAQIDPGYSTSPQVDPGGRKKTQVDAGSQLDPGVMIEAQLDPGF